MKRSTIANMWYASALMTAIALYSIVLADDVPLATIDPEVKKLESCVPKSDVQMQADQIKELRLRLAAVQEKMEKIEQTMTSDQQILRKKDEEPQAKTSSQEVHAFVKNNVFNLISVVTTIAGLYMSYHFNNEMLKLNRASFVIEKGEVAMNNLRMVAAGQHARYYGLVKSMKS